MQTIARRAAAPAFALAMFMSAALIFALQPMFSRLTTPLLGGSPSVWNASMVFFQAALLAGYLYAHLLQRVRDLRVQAIVHAIVLALAFLVLPVQVSGALGPPDSSAPIFWLLGVLTISIGAPFAAASATAPLLQAWYARTGRADAHDPYYLYAASNLGSLLGLILYPILVEPNLGASAQSDVWTTGYAIVAVVIVVCALLSVQAHGGAGVGTGETVSPAAPAAIPETAGVSRPTWRLRLYWIGAAAAASSLLLGVTQHLSTDVASAPFLWVVPLALYLITFIVAFMRGSEKVAPAVLIVHPLSLALIPIFYFGNANWGGALFAHLTCFFLSALICHLALSRTRPSAENLTEFYLLLSLGGVVGGALTALVAPVIFNGIYEYPLALAAIALFRPRDPERDSTLERNLAMAFVLMAGVLIVSVIWENISGASGANAGDAIMRGIVAVILVILAVSFSNRFAEAFNKAATIIAAAALALVILVVAQMFLRPSAVALVAGVLGAAAALLGGALPRESVRPMANRAAYLVCGIGFAGLMIYLTFFSGQLMQSTAESGREIVTLASPHRQIVMALAFLMLVFVVHAALQKDPAPQLGANIALGVSLPLIFVILAFMALERRFDGEVVYMAALTFVALALFLNRNRPYLLAGLILGLFTMLHANDVTGTRIVSQDRSFFGVLRVEELDMSRDSQLRILMHGTTIHGAQLMHPQLQRRPLTYYNAETSLGQAAIVGLATSGEEQGRLALVGLGAGTTACLLRPADQLTIFEIDPLVVRLSGPEGDTFTYVRTCQPGARVEIGDARLQLAEEPDGLYDVIVVDAFSSDAIPAHLLTREAVAMYMRKIKPTGIVVLHLSNRNLALIMEAARVAHSLGLANRWWVSGRVEDPYASVYGGLPASSMILARSEDNVAFAALQGEWIEVPRPNGRPWTDDYINLPRSLWQNMTGAETCFLYPGMPGCGGDEDAPPAPDPTAAEGEGTSPASKP